MGAKLDLPRLKEVAGRQWGVVTRGQLAAIGLSARGIEEMLRTGRLIRLHRGVYAYGHDRLRREGYWLAAVLACGPGAKLSHRSGAALLEIRPGGGGVIDVTVPSRAGRVRREGVRVHRSGRLTAEEVTIRDGIPVTTVARTLLDLADVLDLQSLRRAVTEAEYRNVFDLTALIAVVEANPGRRTRKLMTAATEGRLHRTRSPLEDRFLRFVDRYGVEEPECNVHLRLTGEALEEPDEVLADLVQAGVRVASWPRASSYPSPSRPRISSARAM